MIEFAPSPSKPFASAGDVLASIDPWSVVEISTRKAVIACWIRPAKVAGRDATLKVRVAREAGRRYGDIAWLKRDRLIHKGQYADPALSVESREWRIVERLWRHLSGGAIPDSVKIWPDDALARQRRKRFEADYPDIWAKLIAKGPHRKFNDDKVRMIDRFGWLTENEIASIRDPAAPKTTEGPRDRDWIDDEIH